MSAIDYSGILDAIKVILENDPRTSEARVVIEEEPQPGAMDAQRVVAIFADRRVLTPGQSLAAGKRTRYFFYVSIWSAFFDMAGYREAARGRDELIGKVELVLMANRTLIDPTSGLPTVSASQIEGGELFSARNPDTSLFMAAGQTVLVVEVSAVNE